MIALIVISSVVAYVAGAFCTAYVMGRIGVNTAEGAILGSIFWPIGLLALVGIKAYSRGDEKKPLLPSLLPKRDPKALSAPPPPCRCNGGTEPCKLPPQQAVYR